jgi:hypothetical protein
MEKLWIIYFCKIFKTTGNLKSDLVGIYDEDNLEDGILNDASIREVSVDLESTRKMISETDLSFRKYYAWKTDCKNEICYLVEPVIINKRITYEYGT